MTSRILELLAWIGGICLLLLAGAAWGREWQIRTHLAAQHRAEIARDAYRDSLRVALATVRVDSVTVDRQVTRWRVVRDSLMDTLRTTDTVAVLVQVADSTIGACLAGAGRCREALALATSARRTDSLLLEGMRTDLGTQLRRAERAESRAWWHRLQGAALCGGAVVGLSQLRK
jgi:hypothetical protein